MSPNIKSHRATNIALIDEVKKKHLLWDPNDEDYMDREATAVAWQEIADKISADGLVVQGDIKQKWKCLRDTYRRITRTRPDKDKRSRWPYYRRLNFLQQVPIKKRAQKTQNDTTEYLDEEFIGDTNEDTSQPYEYIKCEGSSDNEEGAVVPLETELDTLDRSEDYDMMFLKSLVPYLKSLEPLRQLIVRNKIQDILLNELAAQQTQKNNKGL